MNTTIYDELFTDDDLQTGENIFYEDEELKIPFNGTVIDYFKGNISWEFEVKDGFRTGIEKKYYDTGELMEINQVEHNTINGLAKEFYRNGNIKSQSIVIRNIFIDSIMYNKTGEIIKKVSIQKDDYSYELVADKIDQYRKKYKID